jgi:hypothetical protein
MTSESSVHMPVSRQARFKRLGIWFASGFVDDGEPAFTADATD